MKIVTLAAGFAAGYVLGTRAGREKYEQIAAGARQVRANPTLGQVQETIKDVIATPRPAAVRATTTATTTGGDSDSGGADSGGAAKPARRRTVAATPAVPSTPLS